MLPERVAAAVLATLADAVTVHDSRGQTVYANGAAAELLGASDAGEVLRARPGELAARFFISHEDGTPVAVEEFPGRRLVAGDAQPEPLLTRSVRRDTGQEFWLVTRASALEVDGERYAVNVIEDVTEAKRAELRRRFLDQAGQVLSSTLDLEATLQRVAQLAVPWLGDWCAVSMPDERGQIRQVALAHVDPEKVALGRELGRRYPPDPGDPAGVPAVLRTGEPQLYPQIPDELLLEVAKDAEHLRVLRELGMRAAMVVPMRAGVHTIGAISFVTAETGRSYGPDDLVFAEDLAARAGAAVENARLYTERAEVARTLQLSLLPEHLPQLDGWEAAASYTPGEQGSEVGGDFYDVFAVDAGVVVLLGDVTGKGVRAAALTAAARHTARTAALFDPRPSAVLALVNRVLRERPALSPVTLACALLRPDGDALVASAGHPPAIVRRADRAASTVGARGIVLGVLDDAEWTEERVELDVGDVMVFYSDGFTDAPVMAGRFGFERLLAAVQTAPTKPDALVGAVEATVAEQQVGSVTDDRALLALQRTG